MSLMCFVLLSLICCIAGLSLRENLDYSNEYLSDQCLRCICAASSDCQTNSRCRVIEPDTYLCGPFRLNEKYWLSSGSLTPSSVRHNNPLAFEMCANNLECSIKTVSHLVRNYLNRCHLQHTNWHRDIKCMLSAFVHYRAVYSTAYEDSSEYDEYTEGDRLSIDEIMSCDVNSTNIVHQVERMHSIASATRSDDNYWPRFDECYHQTFNLNQTVKGQLWLNQCRHLNSLHDISYEHGVPNSAVRFNPSTLGQLLEKAALETPENVAFIVHHQQLTKTYEQFNSDVNQLAKGLYAIGCRRGDPVGIWAVNSYQWLLVQFATAKLGCIFVTVNPGYKERELAGCINLIGLKTLICNQQFRTSNYCQVLNNISPELMPSARGAKVRSKELPSLENLIVLDEQEEIAPSNVIRFSEVLAKGQTEQRLSDLIEARDQTNFDDVINVQFTSGTTGSPKGAMLTHYNIVQNVNFLVPRMFEGYQSADPKTAVICLPNPLYHCFGCVVGSTTTIYLNGTMVLPGPIASPTATLEAIDQYRCNYLYGTPTMWSDLLNVGVDKFDLASLTRGNVCRRTRGDTSPIATRPRHSAYASHRRKALAQAFNAPCVMSGAPCPPVLVRKVLQGFPSLENILIPYGSTELSPVVTMTSIRDDFQKQTETVGRPIDYVEVKIVDPKSGQIVERGAKGEVCIRGHCTFPGYYNQPDKTREVVDQNNWYHTGYDDHCHLNRNLTRFYRDIGHLDKEGYLTISGRIKEMIIRGGENIYPREIEEYILMHDSVEDVHVVGVPDERFGEELVAYVKLKPNCKLNETDLKTFLKPKISHFKVPKHVRFVDDFPRTVTGKVRKVELKEIAKGHFAVK